MNIYLALTLFSVTILVYFVIIEILTVLFRFTGLPDEKARFQVISLLTGCGYTTKESELLLSTRSRRRLTRMTMLFGYVFNITIVSAFINVFLSMKERQLVEYSSGLLIPAATVVLIFLFSRVPAIGGTADKALQNALDFMIGRDKSFNTVELLDNMGTSSIAVVTLYYIPKEYQGVTLAEMNLRADTGIMVMLVERRGRKAQAAGPDTVFCVTDRVTVFGDYHTICSTFHAKERFLD